MKKITLENGKVVEISEESYQALAESVKEPSFKEVVEEYNLPVTQITTTTFKPKGLPISKKELDEIQIYWHMLLWKSIYDADFEPDWEDRNQRKYYIYLDNSCKRWFVEIGWRHQFNMQVYVSSEEKAEKMLEDLKSIGVIE